MLGYMGMLNTQCLVNTRGLFLEGPEKFLHTESHSKISTLMIIELFYSHILNMNRGALRTRSFRRTHLSVFKYRCNIDTTLRGL